MIFKLKKIIAHYRINGVRKYLRGSNQLHRENTHTEPLKIINDLCDTPLQFSKLKDGYIQENEFSHCLQQFMLTRCLRQNFFYNSFSFHERVLAANSSPSKYLKFPLPKEWRNVLEEKWGYKVNTFPNYLRWYCFVLLWYFIGVFFGLKDLLDNLSQTSTEKFRKSPYSFFFQLQADNIPENLNSDEDNTIISWFYNNKNGHDNIFFNDLGMGALDYKGIKLLGVKSVFPKLTSVVSVLAYLFDYFYLNAYMLFKLLTGQTNEVVMLNELHKLAFTKHVDKTLLPSACLFHSSGIFFRPLWTYAIEKLGVNMILYFYSTSDLWMQMPDGSNPNTYNPYQILTWPHYWFWDQHHADFLSIYKDRIVLPFRSEITGPVWFSSKKHESLKKIPPNGIAIFDLQPYRSSFQCKVPNPIEYSSLKIVKQFYQDILSIAEEKNILIYIKTKRKNPYSHKGYDKLIEEIIKSKQVILIDSQVAAKSLIELSSKVISMPFTTPSHIAKLVTKDAVYYDALQITQDNDPSAHGISVIKDMNSLRQWMSN